MMAQLVGLTGAVQLRTGMVIDAKNLLNLDRDLRRAEGDLGRLRPVNARRCPTGTLKRLIAGEGESDKVESSFVELGLLGHFMAYSTDPAVEKVLETTLISGSLPTEYRLFAKAIVNNVGGAKSSTTTCAVPVAYSSSSVRYKDSGWPLRHLLPQHRSQGSPALVTRRSDAKAWQGYPPGQNPYPAHHLCRDARARSSPPSRSMAPRPSPPRGSTTGSRSGDGRPDHRPGTGALRGRRHGRAHWLRRVTRCSRSRAWPGSRLRRSTSCPAPDESPRHAAGRADARQVGAARSRPARSYEPKWDGFRIDRLPRRRRGRARQPQRAADDPLLPRARRGGQGRAARALRHRRRDRHRHRRRPRLRGAAAAHPPGRRRGSRMLREQTPASFIAFDLLALGDDDYTGRPFAERRAALERRAGRRRPAVHVTPATDRPRRGPALVHRVRGRRARRRRRQAARRHLPAGQAGDVQDQARAHRRLRRRRLPACTRAAPDAIGSLLLGLYDDDGMLTRSASSARSRWRGARSCSPSCSRW